MTVRVVTAEQATARDAAAIDAGIPSIHLMRRAGTGAAQRILEYLRSREGRRALVCCGVGNNGGDGWIVAAALAAAGVQVHVLEGGAPRSADARARVSKRSRTSR